MPKIRNERRRQRRGRARASTKESVTIYRARTPPARSHRPCIVKTSGAMAHLEWTPKTWIPVFFSRLAHCAPLVFFRLSSGRLVCFKRVLLTNTPSEEEEEGRRSLATGVTLKCAVAGMTTDSLLSLSLSWWWRWAVGKQGSDRRLEKKKPTSAARKNSEESQSIPYLPSEKMLSLLWAPKNRPVEHKQKHTAEPLREAPYGEINAFRTGNRGECAGDDSGREIVRRGDPAWVSTSVSIPS